MRATFGVIEKCSRCETTPSPVILDLVEYVLHISTVTIELGNHGNVLIQRGDQHLIFAIALDEVRLTGLDDELSWLPCPIRVLCSDVAGSLAESPQDDDTP